MCCFLCVCFYVLWFSLQFRHWTSDLRHQTFLYRRLTFAGFSNLLELLPLILHGYWCLSIHTPL